MMRYFVTICFFNVLFCEFQNSGSGAVYKYGTNAREVAMGKTMNSVYNYGFNAFSNPSLLTNIEDIEFGISLFGMSLDRSIQTISISRPLPPTAAFAVSFFRSGTDNIQGTDQVGNMTDIINSWEGYSMLSFANKIGDISIGFNLKIFTNQITSQYSADGIGLDIGTSFKIFDRSYIGLNINNISSNYNWNIDYDNSTNQYEEKIDEVISIGYSRLGEQVIIASQIDIRDSAYKAKIGMEFNIYSNYKFRIGLDDMLYSVGFGIPFKLDDKTSLNLDYALDFGLVNEGFSHLFTFTLLNY